MCASCAGSSLSGTKNVGSPPATHARPGKSAKGKHPSFCNLAVGFDSTPHHTILGYTLVSNNTSNCTAGMWSGLGAKGQAQGGQFQSPGAYATSWFAKGPRSAHARLSWLCWGAVPWGEATKSASGTYLPNLYTSNPTASFSESQEACFLGIHVSPRALSALPCPRPHTYS